MVMKREGRVEPPTLAGGPIGTGSKGIQIIPAGPRVGKGARGPETWGGVGGEPGLLQNVIVCLASWWLD